MEDRFGDGFRCFDVVRVGKSYKSSEKKMVFNRSLQLQFSITFLIQTVKSIFSLWEKGLCFYVS